MSILILLKREGEKYQSHHPGKGICAHFGGLENVLVLVSSLTRLWRSLLVFFIFYFILVLLLLFGLIHFFWYWCSMTSDIENTTAWPWVPGQLLGTPRPSSQSSSQLSRTALPFHTPVFPGKCTYAHCAQTCILFQRPPWKPTHGPHDWKPLPQELGI